VRLRRVLITGAGLALLVLVATSPWLAGSGPSTLADAPHAGLDFAIGIDVNGDSTDDCNTTNGPAACTVPTNVSFTVKFYLYSLPSGVSAYVGYQARLTYGASLISLNNASLSSWPSCVLPVTSYPAGEVVFACVSGVIPPFPTSTYTGVLATTGFSCPASPSSGSIDVVHGITNSFDTQIYEGDTPIIHAEGDPVSETLTIDCIGLEPLTGDGVPGDCADETATADCRVNQPTGIYLDAGSGGGGGQAASAADSALYYTDTGNNKVKKIAPAPPKTPGTTYDVAGSGTAGFSGDGGSATAAKLSGPRDVFLGPAGDVYIADTENCVIRRVSGTTISTVAGEAPDPSTHCGYDGDSQNAVGARLNKPTGIALDDSGNLFIADTHNHRVRRVDATTGQITTVAGTGTAGSAGNGGLATSAQLSSPHDLYFLLPTEDLLIADTGNNRIMRIDYPAGIIVVFAGTGAAGDSGDGGAAASALLDAPEAISAADYVVAIADTGNDQVRKVDALMGTISTIAGDAGAVGGALDSPQGVAIAPDGSLVVANTDAETISVSGIDLEGGKSTTFAPAHSCTALPGIQTVDWVLPIVLLGGIVMRRRLGAMFTLLRMAIAPRDRRLAT
jgi:sugar lactone lactonase YvrE